MNQTPQGRGLRIFKKPKPKQKQNSSGISVRQVWIGLIEVAQSCPTLCDPMDCSLPGSSVHGIFQARILEQVASLESTNSPIFTTSYYLYLISFIFTPRQKNLSLILLPQRKDQIKIIPIYKFLLIQEKTNKQ